MSGHKQNYVKTRNICVITISSQLHSVNFCHFSSYSYDFSDISKNLRIEVDAAIILMAVFSGFRVSHGLVVTLVMVGMYFWHSSVVDLVPRYERL